MLDKKLKMIARIGDHDPLNEGGAILDHGDGRPTLSYLIPDEDSADDYGEPTRFWRYGADVLDIDDCVNGPGNPWIEAASVASSTGMPEAELRRLSAGTVKERALAILTVAGYYGWEEFDAYPLMFNREEAREYAADLDAMEKAGNA